MYLIRLRFVTSLHTYDDHIANVLNLNSYRLYPLDKLPLVLVEIREASTLDNTGHLDKISSGPAQRDQISNLRLFANGCPGEENHLLSNRISHCL